MGLKQIAQQKAKVSAGLEVPFQLAGAPTNNSTLLGRAVVGSQLVNVTSAVAGNVGPGWLK